MADAEVRDLSERLAREEAARLAAEAEAGQGEKAHDMLENTVSRLTAARKTIKEKEWELVDARRRADHLDRERMTQDRRIRELETALERHAERQNEAERRCSEAHVEADAEAAQQRGELRRQLAAAELARDGAQAEAAAAAARLEEARTDSQRQMADLEARVAESQAQLAESQAAQEELERRLRSMERPRVKSRHSAAHGGSLDNRGASASPDPAEDRARPREGANVPEPARQSGAGLPRPGFGLAAASRGPPAAIRTRRSKAGSGEAGEAVGGAREDADAGPRAAASTPQRERAEPSRQSGAGLPRAGFGMAARQPPRVSKGGLPRSASADLDKTDAQAEALSRPTSMASMPMDLKSLGKLLAGSGVMNKNKA